MVSNREADLPNLYVALVHYPVVNKNGDTITSAITNLDLHDIARAAKTYGVKAFYVVTPLDDQKEMTRRIISHWTQGAGATYNPVRRQALELIQLKDTIEGVCKQIEQIEGAPPQLVATCARRYPDSIGYTALRNLFGNGRSYLLTFGTAWGLAGEFINSADYILEPIYGETQYNHLSVRSAAAIIFDRLLGSR